MTSSSRALFQISRFVAPFAWITVITSGAGSGGLRRSKRAAIQTQLERESHAHVERATLVGHGYSKMSCRDARGPFRKRMQHVGQRMQYAPQPTRIERQRLCVEARDYPLLADRVEPRMHLARLPRLQIPSSCIGTLVDSGMRTGRVRCTNVVWLVHLACVSLTCWVCHAGACPTCGVRQRNDVVAHAIAAPKRTLRILREDA